MSGSMKNILRPADETELVAALGDAVAARNAVAIGSGGGLCAFGRPSDAVRRLELSARTGIVD